MMTYLIKDDGFRFQGFHLDPYDIVDFFPEEIALDDIIQFYAKDLKMSTYWGDVNAKFKPIEGVPLGDIPDICTWSGSSLVFSEKAYNAVRPALEGYGEFLPIKCNENTTHYLFNCLTHGAADELYSKPEKIDDSGNIIFNEKLRFNQVDTENKTIFKTKFNNYSRAYCNDDFKNLVEKHKLTGVNFDSNLTNIF